MRFPLLLLLLLLPVSLLSSTVSTSAHDWAAMRAETQAEFENARMMSRLDCAGLNAYVEQERWLTNQRIHAEYHRSLPGPRTDAVPGAVPVARPSRPR
jgi:hypothetical protein